MGKLGKSRTKTALNERELRKIWTYYLFKKVGFLVRSGRNRSRPVMNYLIIRVLSVLVQLSLWLYVVRMKRSVVISDLANLVDTPCMHHSFAGASEDAYAQNSYIMLSSDIS